MSAPRTAFVLSGGASLGAVQAGMLRALYEQGITADMLVGTSAGALNAAFVASRPQTEQTARELSRIWRDLDREDIFPVSMRALLGGLCRKRDHLVPAHALRRLVGRHCEFDDLADAVTPLHVVAYDIMAGREVLLSEGPAVDAITASATIPGVFPPVAIDDQLLIDGGVVNNTPISHAVALGAERVYVLPTQAGPRRIDRAPAGAIDAAIHALTLLVDARFAADLARYAQEVELIVLPAPNSRCVQPTDFEHASRLTAEALTACRDALAARPSLEVAAQARLGDAPELPHPQAVPGGGGRRASRPPPGGPVSEGARRAGSGETRRVPRSILAGAPRRRPSADGRIFPAPGARSRGWTRAQARSVSVTP